MLCRFDPYIGVTILNIACNSFMYFGPPVVPRYEFIDAGSARVTCYRVIMARVKDFGLELFII